MQDSDSKCALATDLDKVINSFMRSAPPTDESNYTKFFQHLFHNLYVAQIYLCTWYHFTLTLRSTQLPQLPYDPDTTQSLPRTLAQVGAATLKQHVDLPGVGEIYYVRWACSLQVIDSQCTYFFCCPHDNNVIFAPFLAPSEREALDFIFRNEKNTRESKRLLAQLFTPAVH